MAKRNLARTAIEGGRVSSIRVNERFHTRSERRATNAALQRIKSDPDLADELVVDPRTMEYREFADKLNPVYRWLEKQVGRQWNDVFSEVKARFPARSLAGRHIVGHIESYISKEWHEHDYRGDLVVGVDGVLRRNEDRRRRHYYLSVPRRNIELENEVHWVLDSGLHWELNKYLKWHHSSYLGPGFSYLKPNRDLVYSSVKPRLLLGKHDVESFVQDIIAGIRKEDIKKTKDHHYEWRKNLEGFISKFKGPTP